MVRAVAVRAAAVRAMVQMIGMDEEWARKEELGAVAAKAVVDAPIWRKPVAQTSVKLKTASPPCAT